MGENGKNRITVEIYGEPYTIVGEEESSHVRMVASMVDDKMREMKQHNPYLDTKQLAVLTSVNIVNEYVKVKEELDQMHRKQKKDEG